MEGHRCYVEGEQDLSPPRDTVKMILVTDKTPDSTYCLSTRISSGEDKAEMVLPTAERVDNPWVQ